MVNWTRRGPRQNRANSWRRCGGRGLANEGRWCKTNPIPHGPGGTRPGDGDRGLLYKQSQFVDSRDGNHGVLPWPPPLRPPAFLGPVVQTNPICHRRAGEAIAKAGGLDDATRTGANRAKQSQFPGGAGRGEAIGAWDAGESRETKPIPGEAGWDGGRGTGTVGHGTNKANWPAAAGRLRETKPISNEISRVECPASRGEPAQGGSCRRSWDGL